MLSSSSPTTRNLTKRNKRLGRSPKLKDDSGRSANYLPKPLSVRLMSTTPHRSGWHEYKATIVPKQPQSGFFRFRTSTRWCADSRSARTWSSLPFIDYCGQIHAVSVGYWRCSAPQLLATIASTVHKRLWGITRSYRKKSRISSGLLMQVALYYSITNRDSWFRRTLELLKRRRVKDLRNFVYRTVKHMDANSRFLYDQAQNAALWFQSRTERAPYREMSKQRFDGPTSALPALLPAGRSKRAVFDDLLHRWARVYSGPTAKQASLLMINSNFESSSIFKRIIAHETISPLGR